MPVHGDKRGPGPELASVEFDCRKIREPCGTISVHPFTEVVTNCRSIQKMNGDAFPNRQKWIEAWIRDRFNLVVDIAARVLVDERLNGIRHAR